MDVDPFAEWNIMEPTIWLELGLVLMLGPGLVLE